MSFCWQIIFAQEDNVVYELRGRILDIEKRTAVQYAHIINTKKSQACISDSSGNFKMLMLKTDTLKISCIGYETAYFWFSDTVTISKQYFTMLVVPKTYNIREINIFEERWQAFVYDFSNTKIEEDKTKVVLEKWAENLISKEDLLLLSVSSRGVGFPINYKTRRDIQIKRVEEIRRQEELNLLAEQKFNRTLVKKVTGLDGEQLEDFYKYCRLDRDFILKQNDYDLIMIIKELYDIYKEEKM